jgi:heme exporter protein C
VKTQPRALSILDWVTALLMAVAIILVFAYAPIERVMGPVQKIFYFHVSAAWIGMLSFAVAVVAGVAYLITRKAVWDLVGPGAVEIGLVFSFIALVAGSIWARPIWNTWWTWDPRLTTVTIMELVYAAYVLLRQGIEDVEKRARFGAVYAVIGFISVPLTFFSIRIYRTIHPVVIGSSDPNATGSFAMTPAMGLTFGVSLLAFTVLFACLLWHRVRLGAFGQRVEELRLKLMR